MKTVKPSIIEKKGLVIAGPCSAESEEQLLKTAMQLAEINKVDVLRAGIWKPRTNPGGFEGVGVKGLPWLLKAKQLTGLKTAVEVATAKHVEDAQSFDVDILWIGARTTVNPFSVQHIADALKGSDQTVLIKNPVNPDVKLWIGAIERLQKAGLKNIGLIHRGFSSYGDTEFRNTPIWQIPIEVKRLFPELPMICDPSHICGNRHGLKSIMQRSIDLDLDGWIIEAHCDPDDALTDKQQQVTPKVLKQLLETLIYKTSTTDTEDYKAKLGMLRDQIDLLDEALIRMISDRMGVSKKIGEIKKQSNITVFQSGRYQEILRNATAKGEKVGLSKDFVKNYMEAIHIESIRTQNA